MANIIRPIQWTLMNTTNGNSKDDSAGTVLINATFFWLSGAYAGPFDLTRRRTFLFHMASPPSSTQGWIGGFGISQAAGAEYWNTVKALVSRQSGSLSSRFFNTGVQVVNGSGIGSRLHGITVNEDGSVDFWEHTSLIGSIPATHIATGYYIKALGGAYFHDPTNTTARTNTSCVFANSAYLMHDVSGGGGAAPPTVGQLWPRGI